MAKGKKSKGTKYVSKGEVGTNRAITKERRREYMDNTLARRINQLKAWRAGKNVVLVVENTAKKTNRPFMRVSANELWGSPKRYLMNAKSGEAEE